MNGRAKGLLTRKMMAEKFKPEIEASYSEVNLGGYDPVLTATDNLGAIKDYVRASIKISFPVPALKEDKDRYVLSLDSLKNVEIAGFLKAGIEVSKVS